MSMRRKLLGGAALLMAAFSLSEANATSCAVPPTCAQLGYVLNAEDCEGYYMMRCPFALTDDNQVYCNHKIKKVLVTGKILYGDGTVSKDILDGKTPIGVVFDETNKLAIALTNVNEDGSAGDGRMTWAGNSNYDIPNLDNCVSVSAGDTRFNLAALTSCAPDGRANTDKILACGSECGGTPAATAANKYKPAGCSAAFCGQGKWFLPSMKELSKIYEMRETVEDTLTFLKSYGATSTLSSYTWTSNEYSKSSAWRSFASASYDGGGYFGYDSKYSTTEGNLNRVRPIVKY